jgi:hypothetical protein
VQTGVVELALAGRRGQDPGIVLGRQLPGAGEEVGVQVRFGGVRDPQPTPGRLPVRGPRVQ